MPKKTHAEKLKSDPEYALRDKLNQKSNELSRVIGENYKKLDELCEKEKKLNEKFDPLYSDEAKLLQHKAITILDRLDTLTQKEKALDISELLPKEKDKIKNFSSKADELDTKRQALNNKMETYNDRTSILSKNFNKKATDFVNMLQQYNAEMQEYKHKIEYDNKAYEAYLNIREKFAEVMINAAREKEAYILNLEKLYEEAGKIATEDI